MLTWLLLVLHLVVCLRLSWLCVFDLTILFNLDRPLLVHWDSPDAACSAHSRSRPSLSMLSTGSGISVWDVASFGIYHTLLHQLAAILLDIRQDSLPLAGILML